MTRRTPVLTAALAAGLATVLIGAAACGGEPDFWEAYAEIVAEEDARGTNGLARIRRHLESRDPAVRAAAVRALGRMEDPSYLEDMNSRLADPDPSVRSSAAAAVAQSVLGRDPAAALAMLSARIGEERDATALGGLATSLGRLAVEGDARRTVATGLATVGDQLLAAPGDASVSSSGAAGAEADAEPADSLLADSRWAALLGLARGIEAFGRGGAGLGEDAGVANPGDLAAGTAARRLEAVTRSLAAVRGTVPEEAVAARIRRLAVTALVHARRMSAQDALRFLTDPDPGVRRVVVAGAGATAAAASGPGTEQADEASADQVHEAGADAGLQAAVRAGLADLDASVRVVALRAFNRGMRGSDGCGPLFGAFADPDPHVSAVAIGLAAQPCADADAQRAALLTVVREAGRLGAEWRRPARALHSLAALAPSEAAPFAQELARHSSPFVRAWAARTAALAGESALLYELAGDPDPNVRTAALEGLGTLEGGAARSAYAAQLGADDPLLVMTAVRLLTAHASGAVPVPALLDALARFTATERETVRDVRMALLDGIGAAGGYRQDDLAPYLADFDPLVAARATTLYGAVASALGGSPDSPDGEQADPSAPAAAQPTERIRPPLTPAPRLDAARLRELDRSVVILRMAGLGEIVIALRPRLAATNADRFARLAEAGYFDGLVFHRVEPNFVIQGGSPHANEYAGDGPYSRDEISSQPHWRGTVGLSTRGRDTGDAQIFVNLVDNVRLDFNYTIFGEVVEGMDVVDAVQEGAVIEQAQVTLR